MSKMRVPKRKLQSKPCDHKRVKAVGLGKGNRPVLFCEDCQRVLPIEEGKN